MARFTNDEVIDALALLLNGDVVTSREALMKAYLLGHKQGVKDKEDEIKFKPLQAI